MFVFDIVCVHVFLAVCDFQAVLMCRRLEDLKQKKRRKDLQETPRDLENLETAHGFLDCHMHLESFIWGSEMYESEHVRTLGFPAHTEVFLHFATKLQEIQEILATVSVPQCYPQPNRLSITECHRMSQVLPVESLKLCKGRLYAVLWGGVKCVKGIYRYLISKDVCRTLQTHWQYNKI